MVKQTLVVPRTPDERWNLATQMGVTQAVIHPFESVDDRGSWSSDHGYRTKGRLFASGYVKRLLEEIGGADQG